MQDLRTTTMGGMPALWPGRRMWAMARALPRRIGAWAAERRAMRAGTPVALSTSQLRDLGLGPIDRHSVAGGAYFGDATRRQR